MFRQIPKNIESLVQQATKRAKELNALVSPSSSSVTYLPFSDLISFEVRQIESLKKKPNNNSTNNASEKAKATAAVVVDPFANPTAETHDLFVCHLSDQYSLLLNKFAIIQNHTLVVTRKFESQLDMLNASDLLATYAVMHQQKALGYFNCGAESGSSQPHKHLQIIPVDNIEAIPFHKVIKSHFPTSTSAHNEITAFEVDQFKFPHACCAIPALSHSDEDGPMLYNHYIHIYNQLKNKVLSTSSTTTAANEELAKQALFPYNLCCTSEWMMIVKRAAEGTDTLNLNSMGYFGYMLVKSEAQFDKLKQIGPMNLLEKLSNGVD